MWSMMSVNTLDGITVGAVFPESGTWRNQANGVGSGQHTFLLADGLHAQPRAYWRDKFIKHRRTLVLSWEGQAVYAGRIVGTEWDADERRLTVRHEEIRGMFSDRLPFGPEHIGAGGKAPTGGTAFWGMTKRGIAQAVVLRGFSSPNVRRRLPIDFGPTYPAGTDVFEWEWHRFPTIESMLSSVQDSDGGPDVWLDPVWSPTGLTWFLKLGNPHLSAGEFEYVRGVPESPVVGLKHIEDAKRMGDQTWGLGQGTGQDQLTAVKVSPATQDMPVLDRVVPFKNIDDHGALQSLTDGHAVAHEGPTEQWQFRLQVGERVHPALIRPGSLLRVIVPDDEWDEAQVVEGRVLSVSGDMGGVLSVGVA